MKFNVNQQDIQKSLSYCQGVIEKRSTLPILSNVMLDASDSKLTVVATDLDLIFINIVPNIEIVEEGKTTTLGRNGSDYTASIIGAAINANSIEIWSDVNGVLSTNPKIAKDVWLVRENRGQYIVI